MLLNLLWGAGAVVVGIYMIVALVRPERF
ncbi:potassium-transporting ATPase subunit F [Brevundimonas sp.]|nr:potassium-transporting ATPase subunit F [Brevundimonas sp.]